MGRRGGTLLSLFALALLLALPASAAAKSKPITGKLSKRGYTVIALDSQGQATSVVAKPKFKLRPRANKVTLQLRAPNGTYAGPVVFVGDKGGKAKKSKKRKKSKRVIVGVKAGANLGKVKVKAGFAVAKGLAKTSLDTKRTATAKKGVPIGAGNFGRVAVAKLKGPSADRDLDGIPAPVDVDDDGDLVLDDADGNNAGGARAAQAPHVRMAAWTTMFLEGSPPSFGQPVNVNAPGLRDADIEAALRSWGILQVGGGAAFTSGELDCGRLVYCSAGGTGKRIPSGDRVILTNPPPEPFPACCDPDGDGLGSLLPNQGGLGLGVLLLPGAGPDQIRGGDLLIARDTPVTVATTLGSVVATVPALTSYTDELGVTRPISYPITPDSPPLRVVDGPDADSDVSVRLTFWRPQRRALPKEASTRGWIDMGNLLQFAHTPGDAASFWCPEDSYSQWEGGLVPSIQGLPSGSGPIPAFTFLDSAPDRPASRDNTFSYTLNISRCLSFRGFSFEPGQGQNLRFASQFPVGNEPPIGGSISGYQFHHQP